MIYATGLKLRLSRMARAGLAELQRAEQIGRVRHGHGGDRSVARENVDFLRLDRALADPISGMDAQVNTIGVGHSDSRGPGSRETEPYATSLPQAPGRTYV